MVTAVNDSIAVVIVNYNGKDYIEACLHAMDRQTVAPERVLVIDNASSDGSVDIIRQQFPHVELVSLPQNSGFAGGNNHAFELLDRSCSWVALLNPDTEASPDWIATLKQSIQRYPQTAVFSCRLVDLENPATLDGTGDQYHVNGLGWRRDHGAPSTLTRSTEEKIFSPCAAAALYRLDAVRAEGGFDEDYFCYNEDTDLVFRMRLQGAECLHLDDAVVSHAGSGISGRQSDFSLYHGHRNLVWTYFKNMPAGLFWVYLPQHLLLNLVSLLYFSVKGRPAVIFRAKWHAILGLPRVWKKRRAVQARKKVPSHRISAAMVRNPLAAYFNRYAH